ncbi:MAG: DUF4286 family protein [Xanthomonadaceae bacterium]|nr:DUF4286 family protein [Xanthomonadaceae bacterium]
MIVYEVNLEIDAALRDAYLPWLQAHVAEMLRFDGFAAATIEHVVDPAPAAGRFALCVRYRVRDQACLDDYFARHSARMREDGIARFGDGFSATRRVLMPIADN